MLRKFDGFSGMHKVSVPKSPEPVVRQNHGSFDNPPPNYDPAEHWRPFVMGIVRLRAGRGLFNA